MRSPRLPPLESLLPLALLLLWPCTGLAQTTVPAVFSVLADEFDGSLENWTIASGSTVATVAAAARSGAKGLQVTIDSGESHLVVGGSRPVARAEEGYLTFWFDPNSVALNDPGSGFVGDRSVQIAAIKGPNFKNLVAIRFYQTGGQYLGWIEWRDGADSAQWDLGTTFVLPDRWQEITIGFREDSWVAAWVDGVNVRSITAGVTHFEDCASVLEIGKTLNSTLIEPTGTLRFDEVRFEMPRIGDLWVDASSGSDANDGLTPGTAFATIGRASDFAGAGTTVHIEPGVYRETVVPGQGGAEGEPAVYKAEDGTGTVIVRGSVPSADLNWTRLSSNTIGLPAGVDPMDVWWTDLSSWQLDGPPLMVVRLNGQGSIVERLPLSREPDWTVNQPWKHSERWWTAQGGSSATGCDPSSSADCDAATRSSSQLTDAANDNQAGVEAGNLTTLGNLTGAVLRAQDLDRAHYQYVRTITNHNVGAGRITVDQASNQAGGLPGLGWGTKYFVESDPTLIDQAGEWWFDTSNDRLYLWPPSSGNPASQSLEITRHSTAFDLSDRSWIELRDIDFELYGGTVVSISNWVSHRSVGVAVRGCSLAWAHNGIAAEQPMEAGSHTDKRVESLTIEDNEIHEMDNLAIRLTQRWDNGSDADSWTRSGLFDTVIRGNELHHVGFRPSNGDGASNGAMMFRHLDRLTFEDNWVHDTATEGLLISESVVQSASSYDFSSAEIKVGELLFRDNVFERNCQMKSDCAGIRVWAHPPDNHVFRDFLVVGNTFRDILGWSWAGEQRGHYDNGAIPGAGGSGFYMDGTSGMHLYRNVAYNNGNAGFYLIRYWRDGQMILFNNVLADNTVGIRLGGLYQDTHDHVDTKVRNNLVVNSAAYGLVLANQDSEYTNLLIDRNLYSDNGWLGAVSSAGNLNIVHTGSQEHHQTVSAIRANTPFEEAGQDASPGFVDYDSSDHDALDDSRPDFRLAVGSNAVDAGTTGLPASLTSLLDHFGVGETREGSAWDQGVYEGAVGTGEIFSDGFEGGNADAWSS